MRTIEVSDEHYAELESRTSFYKVDNLDDAIGILLERTRLEVLFDAQEIEIQTKAKVEKSSKVREGYLWQTVSKYLPNFPYDFSEVFEVHGSFPSPIDGVAFVGLSENKISEVHLLDYQLGQYANGKHKSQVKKCVVNGDVQFKLIRPSDLGINLKGKV